MQTMNAKIEVMDMTYPDEPEELFSILKTGTQPQIADLYQILLRKFDSIDWQITVYHVTDSAPETYYLDITDSLRG